MEPNIIDIVIPAVETARYEVRCPPNGAYDEAWFRDCIGVKLGEDTDGSWRVRRAGPTDDLRACVFPLTSPSAD